VFLGLLGTFSLTGLRMFLNYRVRRFSQSGGDETRRLEESVAGLRDEIYSLRNDLTDLHERVEFTERVLAQSRQPDDRRLPGS
jgi:predicted nuclease with TOPRIM domain